MVKGLVLALVVVLSSVVSTWASEVPDDVFLDLETVETPFVPVMIKGVCMVPVEPIALKAGCTVQWDKGAKQIKLVRPNEKVEGMVATVGSTVAMYTQYINEINDFVTSEIVLDAAPFVKGATVYVPLDFLVRAIGLTQDKNVDDNQIYLFSPRYMEARQGEGIGETPIEGNARMERPSPEQKRNVANIRMAQWTKMPEREQNAAINVILAWWRTEINYAAEADFPDKLGRQMGQYFRTGTDITLFEAACDLEGFDYRNFINNIQ